MSEIASVPAGKASAGDALPPIQEGVFVGPDAEGTLALIGSECADCGQMMFPIRARCVKCFGGSLQNHRFDRQGKVVTFTVIRQAPPGFFGSVPYALGMVELEAGVQVLTHLVGKPPESWKAGDIVESCGMSLPLDPRAERYGQAFAFRPSSEIQQ